MKQFKIKNRTSIAIINLVGAELISWTQEGKEIMHDGIKFWQKHAPILFPYIGQSTSESRARHGIVRNKEFEVLVVNESQITLKTNLKNEWKDLTLIISYYFVKSTLITEFELINNESKNVEYKLGWHPAFKLESDISNYKINISGNSHLLNKNGNITGEVEFVKENLSDQIFQQLDTIIYKDCPNIILSTDKHVVEMNTNFNVMAIWKPTPSDFLCLEPWTNIPENVEEKLNEWTIIKSNDRIKYKTEVKVKWL